MDSVVVEALHHLSGQLDDPVEFFQAVDADYEEHKDTGFDAFQSAFAARGFGAAGEELIRYLDDNGRLDLVAKVVEQRPEELAAEYQAAADTDDGQVSDEDSQETVAAWQAMLTEYRGYWDGDEANWAAFEQYVVYYANEQGLAGPARRFFDRAATEDKPALFAEYGVEPPSESAEDDGTDPQDALWQAAIEQFGPSWAAWDGTDTGWAEYRDWFYNATNSQDPDMYALAYERLNPLDEVAPDERIAQLRELGFDVSGVGTETADTPEQRVAEFQALADDPSVEGIDREVLDQLLQDPEFDQHVSAAEAELDAELEAALAD